ncbi:MAG: hypothetical protein AAF722_15020 [Cyanobacteria bacterium P01_C01_bin.70]
MKLSFPGQSYTASGTAMEATETHEKATFPDRAQFTAALRRPTHELIYRDARYSR